MLFSANSTAINVKTQKLGKLRDWQTKTKLWSDPARIVDLETECILWWELFQQICVQIIIPDCNNERMTKIALQLHSYHKDDFDGTVEIMVHGVLR